MKALLRIQYYLTGGLTTVIFWAAWPLLFALIRTASDPGISAASGFSPVVLAAFLFGIVPPCVSIAESACRWPEYAKALPYSDGQFVGSRYLFSLLYAAFAAVPAAAVFPVLTLRNPALRSGAPYASAAEAALMFAVTAAAIVLQISAFLYPIHFRRNNSLPTFGAFAALLVLLLLPYLLHIPFEKADGQAAAVLNNPQKLPLWMLADTAVCYPISWLLSRRFHCRKGRNTA